MTATVTIDKAYFETLLRRAELHTSGRDLTTPVDIPTVSIPKVDHDNLVSFLVLKVSLHAYRLALLASYGTRIQYVLCAYPMAAYTAQKAGRVKPGILNADFRAASLREALHNGGIEPETLEILIRGESIPQAPFDAFAQEVESTAAGDKLSTHASKTSISISRPSEKSYDSPGSRWPPSNSWANESEYAKRKPGFYSRQNSSAKDDRSFTPDFEGHDTSLSVPRPERPRYARAEQRTIVAKNLSDRATHKDIVDVVRGGTVLDVFLRANERSASISFVEGKDAQDFMNYVKRNDIYVLGKRLEFGWNDRQFVLPGHVASKIGIGATRNLVIRGAQSSITEERLREDLDHIHNLVIVDFAFKKGDLFLSLNSVHNSLFARTCMMSRSTYKSMRIEWYPDECAQPLPRMQPAPRKENSPLSSVKKSNQMVNRFQMLNMGGDGTEDNSEEEMNDQPSVVSDLSSLNVDHRSRWNARPVAA